MDLSICEIVQVYAATAEVIDAINALDSYPDSVEMLALHNIAALESLNDLLMTTPMRTPADRESLAALVTSEIAQCARDGEVPEACLAQLASRLAEDVVDDLVDG